MIHFSAFVRVCLIGGHPVVFAWYAAVRIKCVIVHIFVWVRMAGLGFACHLCHPYLFIAICPVKATVVLDI